MPTLLHPAPSPSSPGDLVFVFNFHPTNSYTDYRVGCYKPGPYKVSGRLWADVSGCSWLWVMAAGAGRGEACERGPPARFNQNSAPRPCSQVEPRPGGLSCAQPPPLLRGKLQALACC